MTDQQRVFLEQLNIYLHESDLLQLWDGEFVDLMDYVKNQYKVSAIKFLRDRVAKTYQTSFSPMKNNRFNDWLILRNPVLCFESVNKLDLRMANDIVEMLEAICG